MASISFSLHGTPSPFTVDTHRAKETCEFFTYNDESVTIVCDSFCPTYCKSEQLTRALVVLFSTNEEWAAMVDKLDFFEVCYLTRAMAYFNRPYAGLILGNQLMLRWTTLLHQHQYDQTTFQHWVSEMLWTARVFRQYLQKGKPEWNQRWIIDRCAYCYDNDGFCLWKTLFHGPIIVDLSVLKQYALDELHRLRCNVETEHEAVHLMCHTRQVFPEDDALCVIDPFQWQLPRRQVPVGALLWTHKQATPPQEPTFVKDLNIFKARLNKWPFLADPAMVWSTGNAGWVVAGGALIGSLCLEPIISNDLDLWLWGGDSDAAASDAQHLVVSLMDTTPVSTSLSPIKRGDRCFRSTPEDKTVYS